MTEERTFVPLTNLSRAAQWGILLAGSVMLSGMLELAGLPAALLLGSMVAAILVETSGGTLRVPRLAFYAAQAIIGCMVAKAITPVIIGTFIKDWPLFLSVVLAVILSSAFLGWAMSRAGIFPGTTAIWGLSPGAASVMMLMAGAYGADMRLVAFMQYLRVVFVALAASVVARFVVHVHGPAAAHFNGFPPIQGLSFVETIALAVGGGIAGKFSKIPAGILLVPMFVGALLHGTGQMNIELPQWLLAISYTILGWNIGMGFNRKILLYAMRTLPQTVLAILVLMLFCGGLASLLVKEAGIDPLTAYLATSPGGMDSAAIIAASSKVDISFVIALQTARFMILLLIGPTISRFFASRIENRDPSPATTDTAQLIKQVQEDEEELN